MKIMNKADEPDKNVLLPEVIDKGDTGSLAAYDPLQLYINKVKENPTLTREEEYELAVLYKKTGDKNAAFRLVTSNLLLVIKLAFEFRSQFQNVLDLIQEGNYGLLRAVQKFDPFKGTRLSTYAAFWIRAYMLKYLLDNWRLVKVGTTNVRRKMLYNLRDIERKLAEGGEEPTNRLLAEHFGTTEKDVIEVQQSLGASDTSIHQPVEDGSSREVGDTLRAKTIDYADDISEKELKQKFLKGLEKFRKNLKPSDLTILNDRILSDEPLTLQQIGEKYGVTREAMRQAEGRLLKRLKEFMRTEMNV